MPEKLATVLSLLAIVLVIWGAVWVSWNVIIPGASRSIMCDALAADLLREGYCP